MLAFVEGGRRREVDLAGGSRAESSLGGLDGQHGRAVLLLA